MRSQGRERIQESLSVDESTCYDEFNSLDETNAAFMPKPKRDLLRFHVWIVGVPPVNLSSAFTGYSRHSVGVDSERSLI